uniref:Uncharacterized protein n=1 Tax=Myotis myotis TaxID=51298 RepID=A0A7J7SRN7_MYOMY|nr:hypothetical protein mMyoMyo1_009288 [Myotis myotis]
MGSPGPRDRGEVGAALKGRMFKEVTDSALRLPDPGDGPSSGSDRICVPFRQLSLFKAARLRSWWLLIDYKGCWGDGLELEGVCVCVCVCVRERGRGGGGAVRQVSHPQSLKQEENGCLFDSHGVRMNEDVRYSQHLD